MLTKKHFEGVAEIIRNGLPRCGRDEKGGPCGDGYVALVHVATCFAVMALREHSRFNCTRFFIACGLDLDIIQQLLPAEITCGLDIDAIEQRK